MYNTLIKGALINNSLSQLIIFFLTLVQVQAQIYVDPVKGNDQNDGTLSRPYKTVAKARDVVRAKNKSMSGDLTVYLRGGVYSIDHVIEFTERDGGMNGFNVIYKAYSSEVPVFDAGKKITGWKNTGDNIWKASGVDADIFRQLYVNGKRAQRARSAVMHSGKGWPRPYTSFTDDGWELKREYYPDGIKVSKNAISSNYKNQKDIELVWIGEQSKCTWRSHRLLVNELIDTRDDSTVIKIDNYGYVMTSASMSRPLPENPFYIENALELLDEPGEWYFDRMKKELYYKPRSGENMKTAEVIIPQNVETILSIKGKDLSHKVSNLQFEGITFQYTTWTRPSTSRLGACTNQADKYIKGYGQIGRAHKAIHRKESFFDPSYDFVIDDEGEAEGFKPDACIELNAVENVSIRKCIFIHLGAVGIDMTQGCNKVVIEGNVFTDLSATSIVIGRWDQDYVGEGEEICKNVSISNNNIYRIGQEYYNSPGITAFFTDGLLIRHNEIKDVPYSGISSGWGSWKGKTSWTTSNRKNVFEFNRIDNICQLCSDGGGIYTVGIGKSRTDPDSVNSIIRFNYISNTNLAYGGLYPDEGSSNYALTSNVLENMGEKKKWLHLWIYMTHDIKIDGNFSNTRVMLNKGVNTHITNHVVYSETDRPGAAEEIVKKAGLESEFRSLLLKDDPRLKGTTLPAIR